MTKRIYLRHVGDIPIGNHSRCTGTSERRVFVWWPRMPSAPKRFRPHGQPTRTEQIKAYDARRGSASERGYGRPWAKAAEGHRRNSPLCIGCLAAGLVVAAELVDHVEPHKGDTAKFWDTSMWQSSCRWHHDVVKQRLELMWARGEIPASALWLNSPLALKVAAGLRGDGEGVGQKSGADRL